MDFRDYKTRSRYSLFINEGCTACLSGQPRDSNPHEGAERDAWFHGWDETARVSNTLLAGA